jgi:deoxyadenosine/deoxycytidine kinase
MKSQKKIFCVMGSMASGKTTMVDHLKKSIPSVEYLSEPVDLWLQITNDQTKQNILGYLYADPKRWAYSFESIAYITRAEQLRHALKSPEVQTIVVDGALALDKNAYARKLYDEGAMDSLEWKAYDLWAHAYESRFKKHKICYIYLRCDPKRVLERMLKRHRPEEMTLTIDHFNKLNQYLEQWVEEHKQTDEIITIDFNCEEDSPEYQGILEQITEMITKKCTL